MELQSLYDSIVKDSQVDTNEVNQLRELLYRDGKIDQSEADMLFRINDACSGSNNCADWDAFFIEAISDYLLKDEQSPNVIDEEEARWLISHMMVDQSVDNLEKQLLIHLSTQNLKLPQSLNQFINSQTK